MSFIFYDFLLLIKNAPTFHSNCGAFLLYNYTIYQSPKKTKLIPINPNPVSNKGSSVFFFDTPTFRSRYCVYVSIVLSRKGNKKATMRPNAYPVPRNAPFPATKANPAKVLSNAPEIKKAL